MTETIPIACSLERSELTGRVDLLGRLGAGLVAVEAEELHATLRFRSEAHAELEEFIQAERRCCTFLELGLTEEQGVTRLAISAPEDGGWAVRGLVAGFVAGWGALA